LTYHRDAHGRPGLYLDVVGPAGIHTKTDVPGFVSALERRQREEREAARALDEKVTHLTGEREEYLEAQIARLQQTINAMLRRLPPEELDALLVAVRGYT
jgi:Tfp pilus assembly protein PilO